MTAIVIVLAYLLGSIPSGIWIGKYFYQTDIRKYGSGNSGTTNTFRVLGKKAGIIVLTHGHAQRLSGNLIADLAGSRNPSLIGRGCCSLRAYVSPFRWIQRRQSRCHQRGYPVGLQSAFFWGSSRRFRHLPVLLQNGQLIQHPGLFYGGRSFLLL